MDKDKGLRRLCWTAILLSVLSLFGTGAVAYASHLQSMGIAAQLREVAGMIDAAALADDLRKAAEELRRMADGLER